MTLTLSYAPHMQCNGRKREMLAHGRKKRIFCDAHVLHGTGQNVITNLLLNEFNALVD